MICDPLTKKSDIKGDMRLVEIHEGLPAADIISLHAAGDNPIIASEEFALMQDGVIILNSARGTLIDEESLIVALNSGKVASAWMDAFAVEPYAGKLTEYEQMLLTPHMSTYSEQCRKDMEMAAVNNMIRDLGF